MSKHAVIACRNLSRSFTDAGRTVEVLKGVSLDIQSGETAAILGASGSGKSTLLHLMGGLDQPTEGEVWVDGQGMHALKDAERGRLRNQAIGFVYQFHHLLPEFTALENAAMPLLIRRVPTTEAREAAAEVLEQVGLGHRLEHKPGELSGGERQRAAVARALVTRPQCVLADEPTGNLDSRTGGQVADLMLTLNERFNTALVMVTHDRELAARMNTIHELEDGILKV
ncbi:lipoprotein-releasing system ATP-binding protein [Natronospira proteinivora]|uniref:Lipoprotein-releasing system ATP-binding protein LolD n=1 Tax=Natronospira proteinivora TaxID=1807133 RepID=A0ABT1G6W8_9GAMM|nr:lipoprotein-releasing ABC transporter ATP-binding protein LolD [Natronospira proteinivora]MCP1726700.1 lipoprotein-releasing system ATP-binding protein [Natronospira proteinivora]